MKLTERENNLIVGTVKAIWGIDVQEHEPHVVWLGCNAEAKAPHVSLGLHPDGTAMFRTYGTWDVSRWLVPGKVRGGYVEALGILFLMRVDEDDGERDDTR